MNVLRRAWLLGLPRLWRRPPSRLRPCAAGRLLLSTLAGEKKPLRRWGAAASASLQAEEEEEEFCFPEYVPEGSAEEDEQEPRVPREEEEEEPARPELSRPRRQPRGGERHEPAGRPDPSVASSGVSCPGCGAELHCRDSGAPGYLPSEKYLSLMGQGEEGGGGGGPALEGAVCQRCWLLQHHQRALQVQLSREEYRSIVSAALRAPPRHGCPHLVLCLVDVLELPDMLLPDLRELVGSQAHIFVLGNKVDLLPGDSPKYLKRLREYLLESCIQAGLMDLSQLPSGARGQQVVDVHLISAKTGYGVEELISKLQRSWKFNGDVFLVGATNTGKSTLFNTLLHSDYCKSRASDVISRATISPWPGTTLNLLKFPIINPTPYRIFQRKTRLMVEAEKTEEDLSEDEKKQLNTLRKQGYLIGRIGRTFQVPQKLNKNREIDFDAEALSFNSDEEPVLSKTATKKAELTYNEVKDARWFHDTPGIVKDNCVLNLLQEKEVKLVLPTCAIVPRTFLLKPGFTLFLGALGRIDYLQGARPSWFSVLASNLLPVHVTSTERADAVYQKHAGRILLKVPTGGEERMKDFPSLIPQDVMLEGIGDAEAVADIKLSSAGWVAITAHSNNKMHLRCYTPQGTALTVRRPPLLPHVVHIKGVRVKGSPAYRTKRPPSFVENMNASVNQKKKPCA